MTWPQLTLPELSSPFCPLFTTHTHPVHLSVPIQVAPTSGTLPWLFPLPGTPCPRFCSFPFFRWRLKCHFLNANLSAHSSSPNNYVTLLYFPHRTYCYQKIILFVCLLAYCLSLPLEYKQGSCLNSSLGLVLGIPVTLWIHELSSIKM